MLNKVLVCVDGRWTEAPGFDVDGKSMIVSGRWVKVASVYDEDWIETELSDPRACLRELEEHRRAGLRVDVMTFGQKIPNIMPRYDYTFCHQSVASIAINSYRDWWESVPQETRKNVRRSQKRGVEIKIREFSDELVSEIATVNNERPVRQGRRFPHYGKSFDEVKKDYSSFLDRSDMICAYSGSELIGFLKVVYRGNIASVLQLLVKLAHQDKRPANALLSKAVELCADKRLSHLTYGMFRYGNKGDSSLTEFKRRHGFQEMLVPRYYVPLTGIGRFYTSLGLYRGILGLLPGSVIRAGVRARSGLYRAKDFMSRCSSRVEQPKSNRSMERSSPPAGSSSSAPLA